ncbi:MULTISPECIES: Fe-S-containing hydro-lyase [Cytobacillus]|uniref:Fumarate hydratase n=2 Tax=Cytobacillus TaxID=2675230 RepID=A0ABX3CQE5_9BACI|nr:MULTISPECIES: Fe-S-containing hydro-lyase [Cytobacillus]MCS0822534.1 Fe-S-containing hydro-lyase [Cytobacillus firmus]MBU8728980.1 Fe-S-containing hydro-lyase [Cytobacillus oceanisediminis]MCM3244878.1 Fe-S-containing hydro-lyase [Cytobacillus oceanisediminis]MCM3403130.1 Fe-S-containing hydro-lyase [Cytobacillus oceanisediminis]MDK7665971.1 Fe-S-containing hydro-lyase [Cytobacillus oceanisediminis]
MSAIKVTIPIEENLLLSLKAGERVLLSGTIYTARDAAHKRMSEALEKGEDLPFNIEGQTIYYVGPTPAKPGQVIGSAGPTTSGRMDKYTPSLLDRGLKGMIGKGYRSKEVIDSMKKNKAVYFAAIGGSGALIARSIKTMEVIAYEDLGPEAIYKLTVRDFPAVVIIDSNGTDWYQLGKQKFNDQNAGLD